MSLYIHQTFKLWFPKIRVPKGRAVQQTPSGLDSYLSFQQSVSVVAPLLSQCPKGCRWKTAPWGHATDSHATPSRVSIVHEQKASCKLVLAWNPIVFENPEAVNPSTRVEVESYEISGIPSPLLCVHVWILDEITFPSVGCCMATLNLSWLLICNMKSSCKKHVAETCYLVFKLAPQGISEVPGIARRLKEPDSSTDVFFS